MKNINLNPNDNLEEILKTETLPVSINNEVVILSYEEYMSTLRKIDPTKAEEIESAIKEYQFQEYAEKFTPEIIARLKSHLKATWHSIDFKNETDINSVAGTMGFFDAIKESIKDEQFAEEWIAWYNSLPWDESDYFDTFIESKLLEK